MNRVISDRERAQRANARLRVLQHFDQVTHNISRTCRFFGVSRTLFYEWRRRYLRGGLQGLRPRLPGPRVSPFRTPPHIEALVLRVRQERQYGVPGCASSFGATITFPYRPRPSAGSCENTACRAFPRSGTGLVPRSVGKFTCRGNRSRSMSNISRPNPAACISSRRSMRRPAIACSRSTTTTPFNRRFTSSMKSGGRSQRPFVESKPTTF